MAARMPSGSPESTLIRAPGPVLGLAFAVATVIVIRFSSQWATTYSGRSSAALAADLSAGLGMIGAGLLLRREHPRESAGPLAIMAGALWLMPDWIGWQDGPPLVRSIAAVVAPFFLPVVLHLVLVFRAERSGQTRVRTLIAVAYGIVGAASIGQALFRDPRTDLYCWNNCTDNSFLLSRNIDAAEAFRTTTLVIALCIGTFIALGSMYRLIRSTPTARRMLWVFLVPGLFVGASSTLHDGFLLGTPLEGPQIDTYVALFHIRAWPLAALALGLAWTIRRVRATRSAVARLASDLGEAPRPGALRAALRRATGDPNLEVAYWLPAAGRYSDATGVTVDVPASRDNTSVTPVVRDGVPAAVVLHDASIVSSEGLERELGPAARLAVDNERLHAAVLTQLADLQESRARLIDVEDAERRRLERNLHDGAQQRLLALLYALQVARSRSEAAHDPQLTASFDSSIEQLQAALAELRDLAHGIYPAILDEVGLGQALTSLAETSPIPVELIETIDGRFARPIERAAYVAVADALEEAVSGGATYVGIRASLANDRLVIRIDGVGRIAVSPLADRVRALGGHASCDENLFRVEIPCALS